MRINFHRKSKSLDVSKSCRPFETLEKCNKSLGSSRLKISRRMSNWMSFISFDTLRFDSAIALSFNSSFSLEVFCFFKVFEPCAFVMVVFSLLFNIRNIRLLVGNGQFFFLRQLDCCCGSCLCLCGKPCGLPRGHVLLVNLIEHGC